MMEALAEWIHHLEGLAAEPPTVEADIVRVTIDPSKVRPGEGLNLGPALEGYTIALDGAFQVQTVLQFEDPLPRAVEMHVPSSVDNLVFAVPEGLSIPCILLNVDARENEVDIRGIATRVLIVKGGKSSMWGPSWPQHLDVEDTTFGVDQSFETLTVGETVIANKLIQARKVFTRGTPTIGGAEWRLGDLLSMGAEPPRLCVASGHVRLRRVAEKTEIRCEGGILDLGSAEDREPMTALVLSGASIINVLGWLELPRFVPDDRPVSLNLSGRVLDAEGDVALRASARGVVSGADSGAFVLKAVHEVTGAEVENVNIYSLTIGDLGPLSGAERFYPWLPSARQCREREDKMFGDDDNRLARRQRMHFWAAMTDIVRQKHAPGRVQSEVRYAAQRARRRALPLGREKLLLASYGLLGYGERILRPLLWYAVLSLGLAVWFADPAQRDALSVSLTAKIWLSIAEAPLAFFRLAAVPALDSTPQETALLGFRVIGLLLLVLFVLAMRRLVRLE